MDEILGRNEYSQSDSLLRYKLEVSDRGLRIIRLWIGFLGESPIDI